MAIRTAFSAAGFALAFIGLCGPAAQATQRTRHRHATRDSVTIVRLASRPVQVRDPAEFYPEQIEGGVRGNLSFNNQIRKHVDPLNANGGGG